MASTNSLVIHIPGWDEGPPIPSLTRREMDVLILIAMECANTEIANTLGISVRTVESHIKNMLRKSSSKTRTGLIAQCYASGVLKQGVWPPRRSEWAG